MSTTAGERNNRMSMSATAPGAGRMSRYSRSAQSVAEEVFKPVVADDIQNAFALLSSDGTKITQKDLRNAVGELPILLLGFLVDVILFFGG